MVIEEMNSLTKDEDFDELKNKYQEITSVLAAASNSIVGV